MFSWSAGFCAEPPIPGQRSPEELVTQTLMLELGTLLKRTERLHQERDNEIRRRHSSVDYSWLATAHQKPLYEPSPGELLDLHDLCTKIRPSQCGPVILRLRKLVAELEPDAHEVPRILRTVLLDCLDEEEQSRGQEESRGPVVGCPDKPRSKSLSFITQGSRFLASAMWGSRSCQPPEAKPWAGEDQVADDPAHVGLGGETRPVKSMSEMSPVEQMAES